VIQERKWFLLFGYRPESIDKKLFFDELNKSLSKAAKDYEHLIVAGDFNIEMNAQHNTDRHNYLSELWGSFDLKNIIKGTTCNMCEQGSSIDVILTNKPRSFFNTSIIETGLSDHNCMISTFLRCHFEKLPPKNVVYRKTTDLNKDAFINDIKNIPMSELHRFENPFTGYETLFKCIVDRHCPIKTKKVRGNDKPFMSKELSNAIKDRSRIINKYNKFKFKSKSKNKVLCESADFCNIKPKKPFLKKL